METIDRTLAPVDPMDLRRWLDRVQAAGELQVVEGADWNQELCAISHVNIRQPGHKALLFDHIKGYPKGVRLLVNTLTAPKRLGMTLNLGDDLDHARLLTAVDGKPLQWERAAADFPVEFVDSGPILENVDGPSDYNFFKFPVPLWHQYDGGRYMGTGVAVITADPETGKTNAGSYRMMVKPDGKTTFIHMLGARHGMLNCKAWWEKQGRAPIVAVLGYSPLLYCLAGNDLPYGVSELEYAGAITGRSVQAIRGVTGLPIPATAEIVVEGWIYPDRTEAEGPFGEWHGHYSGLRRNGERAQRPDPVLEVERVYYRNNPILLGAPPGQPPHDFSYFRSVLKSAMIKDSLVKAGVPGVKSAWVYQSSGSRCFMVVSVKPKYLGHARQAGFLALEGPAGYMAAKFCIVVDDDIDPADMDQVIWALCFRCQPAEDIEFIRKSLGDKGDNTVDLHLPYSSRAVIDATIPVDRQETAWMVCTVRPDLLDDVKSRWAHLWQ